MKVSIHICDRLWINQPSTAKLKFWVRPKIIARSGRGRYLVYVVGVIYGVLATLCCSTKRQLSIYSFSRSDLKCHRYCTRDVCAEQLQRTLNLAFLEI